MMMPNVTVAASFFDDETIVDASRLIDDDNESRLTDQDNDVLLEGKAKDELSNGPAQLDNKDMPNSQSDRLINTSLRQI
jgi:hypothetical protein